MGVIWVVDEHERVVEDVGGSVVVALVEVVHVLFV